LEILNQPKPARLGDRLKALLNQRFDTFYLVVAYVRSSGVAHLQSSLERFRASGGRVKAVVGVDQNTSVQGLRLLLPLCDEVFVFHNRNAESTFHPKIYAFERKDRAVVFVGSSNLTGGGLYTNYETNCYFEYDLAIPHESDSFSRFKQMFESYSSGSRLSKKLCRQLTGRLIEVLNSKGFLSDETKRPAKNRRKSGSSRSSIFGSEYFAIPSAPRVPEWRLSKKAIVKGPLLWRKRNLPASDAQQVKAGTQPTGGLRLTQAEWKVNDSAIDQTTYFRETIFRDFKWREVRAIPKVEIARVLFRLIVSGRDKGQHRLQIRHKPSGEAGQRNYTTLLSWTGISNLIKRANLTGKTFSLYGPPLRKREPFCIEIE